jgi:hypothetical protein
VLIDDCSIQFDNPQSKKWKMPINEQAKERGLHQNPTEVVTY